MLRALVGLLLLANAVFFGWSQGWLDALLGTRAPGDREPQRLAQQLQPDSVRVLAPAAASAALASAAASAAQAAAGTCLEAGPYTDAQIAAAESALAALPPGSWSRVSTARLGSYMVYMGRYGSPETLARKEGELNRLKIGFEPVTSPPEYAQGLALSRHATREEADAGLAAVHRQGVRTARVVTLSPAMTEHRLRIAQAKVPLVEQAAALNAPALREGFAPCPEAR